MEDLLDPGKLPPPTLVLIEDLAQRLDMAAGFWRLEIDFDGGRLQVGWRHQRFTKTSLVAFDQRVGAVPT